MTENPYRLARDIRGIGFKTADAIAMKLGIEKTAMIRVRAGISYALTEAMDEGHCGLPSEELVPLAVGAARSPAGARPDGARAGADRGNGGRRHGRRHRLHLPGRPVPGRAGASPSGYGRLANGTLPWPAHRSGKGAALGRAEDRPVLAESQDAAIRLALLSKVLVITGGPGVGKTTIVNSILRILAAKGRRACRCARRPAGPPSG